MSLSQGGILAIAIFVALVVTLGSASLGLIRDRRVRANRLNRIRAELSRDTVTAPATGEARPQASDPPSSQRIVPGPTAEAEAAPQPDLTPEPVPPAQEKAIATEETLPVVAQTDQRLLELRPTHGELVVESWDRAVLSRLRANIARLGDGRPIHIVAVTSADASVQGAATAIALAFSEEPSGRVLLVECMSRHRTLGAWIGVPPGPGLIDFLAGDAKPQEVVGSFRVVAPSATSNDPASPAQVDRADVSLLAYVVAGTQHPRATELLRDQGFRSFLTEVSQVYDTVVLDCGEYEDGSSPAIEAADAVVVCARTSEATDEAQTRAILPDATRAGQAGLVLFKASSPPV